MKGMHFGPECYTQMFEPNTVDLRLILLTVYGNMRALVCGYYTVLTFKVFMNFEDRT